MKWEIIFYDIKGHIENGQLLFATAAKADGYFRIKWYGLVIIIIPKPVVVRHGISIFDSCYKNFFQGSVKECIIHNFGTRAIVDDHNGLA